MLLLGQYALHRVPVLGISPVDSTVQITNLITQSALLKLLDRHMHFFSGITKKSLLELGLGTPKKVSR